MINGNCVFKTVEYLDSRLALGEVSDIYFLSESSTYWALKKVDMSTMPYPTLYFSNGGSMDLVKFKMEFKDVNPVDLLGFKVNCYGKFEDFAQAIITDGFNDLIFLV